MSEPRFPDAPERIKALPVDHRGFPVPWFVEWFENGNPCTVGHGEPDFRVMRRTALRDAYRGELCWICGQKLGRLHTFVIGPMCAVNHVSSEPPSHFECATFAAKACPFLVNPRMRRNYKGKPEEAGPAGGISIERNPGVTLLWATLKHRWKLRRDHGILFDIGKNPERVLWYAHGRPAIRLEVMASIESGLPILRDMAEKDGPLAVAELNRLTAEALLLVPQ